MPDRHVRFERSFAPWHDEQSTSSDKPSSSLNSHGQLVSGFRVGTSFFVGPCCLFMAAASPTFGYVGFWPSYATCSGETALFPCQFRRVMRISEEGVAGFFEDLPVLMIILGAVSILVTTGARISEEIMSSEAEKRLTIMAGDIIDRIRSEIAGLGEIGTTPLLSSLARLNLTQYGCDSTLGRYSFRIVIAVLHPEVGQIVASAGQDLPGSTRAAVSCAILNAIDELGRSIILEARAVVW